MLKRTHLAIGLAFVFYFLPYIQGNKFIFLGVVLLASLLPDVESGFSAAQRHAIFSLQPIKMVFHKNSVFHTYSFLIPVTIAVAIFSPRLGLPFFLGYSSHLLIDSFSPNGIKPFWPLKHHVHGKIVPGGGIDKILFVVFLGVDLIVLFNFIMA